MQRKNIHQPHLVPLVSRSRRDTCAGQNRRASPLGLGHTNVDGSLLPCQASAQRDSTPLFFFFFRRRRRSPSQCFAPFSHRRSLCASSRVLFVLGRQRVKHTRAQNRKEKQKRASGFFFFFSFFFSAARHWQRGAPSAARKREREKKVFFFFLSSSPSLCLLLLLLFFVSVNPPFPFPFFSFEKGLYQCLFLFALFTRTRGHRRRLRL